MQDAFWIAVATGLSRVMGLVREIVIADQFGASGTYDAYLIAFFIPHFLRRLLAEGALSNAFIPLYTERLRRDRTEADAFASTVLSVALVAFPLIVAAGVWLAPLYVPFLASGFPEEKLALATSLSRLTFPYIALAGLGAIVMGILNSHGKFLVPALAPVMFNLGIIFCVLAFAGLNAASLALGVLVGGTAQLLMQLPQLRGRVRFRWRLDWHDPGLQHLLRLMLPAIMGLAAVQINLLVDNKLASYLEAGSISAMQYAIRLFQLPLGVVAVAISTAILPRLSAETVVSPQSLLPPLRQGVLVCALVLAPATLGLGLLGEPVIRLLFEHGAFTPQDTQRTLNALVFYAVGLLPYGLVIVMTRAFYALKDMKTPLYISLVVVAVNVALSLLLVGPMGIGGLALATGLAGWVNLVLVWGGLTRQLGVSLFTSLTLPLLKALLATLLMGGGVWVSLSLLQRWTDSEFVLAVVPTVLGLVVYIGLIGLLTGKSLLSILSEPKEV